MDLRTFFAIKEELDNDQLIILASFFDPWAVSRDSKKIEFLCFRGFATLDGVLIAMVLEQDSVVLLGLIEMTRGFIAFKLDPVA